MEEQRLSEFPEEYPDAFVEWLSDKTTQELWEIIWDLLTRQQRQDFWDKSRTDGNPSDDDSTDETDGSEQ